MPKGVYKRSAKFIESMKGSNHHNWKGDYPKYNTVHKYMNKLFKKTGVCTHCKKINTGKRSFHLANISHIYKRELLDWIELCASCNRNYDYGNITLNIK